MGYQPKNSTPLNNPPRGGSDVCPPGTVFYQMPRQPDSPSIWEKRRGEIKKPLFKLLPPQPQKSDRVVKIIPGIWNRTGGRIAAGSKNFRVL